ncbi:MAG TPA: energy transducer TonB [Thermoanaerobaculia bacterium]
MWIFFALVLTAFSQTTEQSTAAEQPGAPPAAESSYSKKERIALCKKKQNVPRGPSEPQPLTIEGEVVRPTILHQVKPVHASPPAPGTVILQIVVDEDGCVRDPSILQGVNKYRAAADLKAVRQWVFLPATLDGKPVSVTYVLTVKVSRGYGPPPEQLLEQGAGWTRPADSQDEVFVFNIYRTGSESLPRTLEGCDYLGSVSATVPGIDTSQSIGLFNPGAVLPTIKARAARKSANTVVVSFVPGASEYGRSTLRGTAFRCGDQSLPPELGEPLR